MVVAAAIATTELLATVIDVEVIIELATQVSARDSKVPWELSYVYVQGTMSLINDKVYQEVDASNFVLC